MLLDSAGPAVTPTSSTTETHHDDQENSGTGEGLPRERPEGSPWALEHLARGACVSAHVSVQCAARVLIQCSSVIWKLMSFTFAMITLPISTYFFSVNFVFGGGFPASYTPWVSDLLQATQRMQEGSQLSWPTWY